MTPASRALQNSRDLQNKYDVVVVGAGPAGICAAAAAASSPVSSPAGGPSVLLLDSSNRFGGSVTAAMHRSMCGLYSRAPKNILDTLNGSAQRDVIRRMVGKDPSGVKPRQFGRAWVLEFPVSAWESTLSEICSEAKIDLRLGATVTAVQRRGDRLTAIEVNDSVPRWIDVQAVIDCTGGGNILRLAGADAFLPPDDAAGPMLAGFSVRLAGLVGDPEIQRLQTVYALAKGVDGGMLPRLARVTAFYPGPAQAEGICKLAVNLMETSAVEAESFANQVVSYLQQQVPGFSAARVVEMSPRVLARDGLRLRGKYIVTERDILQARKHGAGAVHAWWPMEKWDFVEGPTYAYPPVGEHYDIPDDAFRSAVIANLFAAGTCISATSAAAASTRASGICLATGDAAGKLAVSFINH
jgi:2-polyprenyl-6-methoxyphenol hydroxylase-like FAD-dependent oxidoreductase